MAEISRFSDGLGRPRKNKWCPEEASIVTSNNLILFFKGNLVFVRGTNGGTELFLLSGSFPESNSTHIVSIHSFPLHGKPNSNFDLTRRESNGCLPVRQLPIG
ncbi:hypothetical protein [Sphingopyxis sp. GC21]|uniref:hypothetical protein n=1 Tax=Sphingopyxis sp. GC21 TaxID=2933562 RepID=UPI0021E3BD9E|nr:hypothetical protein [Sphingopyxis sp. GC21]